MTGEKNSARPFNQNFDVGFISRHCQPYLGRWPLWVLEYCVKCMSTNYLWTLANITGYLILYHECHGDSERGGGAHNGSAKPYHVMAAVQMCKMYAQWHMLGLPPDPTTTYLLPFPGAHSGHVSLYGTGCGRLFSLFCIPVPMHWWPWQPCDDAQHLTA